jgi:hypothetical protein
MPEAPDAEYLPLWLTAEEHQTLFGELLNAPEGFKAERVADLLKRADARAQDAHVQLSAGDNSLRFNASSRSVLSMRTSALSAARRIFIVTLFGTALLMAVTLYLVSRR